MAEGIFDVLAVFNETNEFVLYYHRFLVNWHHPRMIFFQWTENDQSIQTEGWKVDCQLQGAGVFPPYSLLPTSLPRLI